MRVQASRVLDLAAPPAGAQDSLLLLGEALSLDNHLVDFFDRAGTPDLLNGLKGRPLQLKTGRNRDLYHVGIIHDASGDRSVYASPRPTFGTRDHAANDLTSDERDAWKKLINRVNKASQVTGASPRLSRPRSVVSPH